MDERLLAAVRRLWSDEQVQTAYAAVLTAYANASIKEVSIIGHTFDGQNANAAIILDREGMREWMDVLEARLREIESAAEDPSLSPLITGSPITNFSTRYVGT